jgi:cobalt-zinc-cadmium efflux system outer membrane protein
MKVRLCVFAIVISICSRIPLIGQNRFNLEQLVASAFQRNSDLLATRQRQQEAAGLLRQAGLRPNPSISVEASNGAVLGSRGEYDFALTYAHTFERGDKRALRIATSEPGMALARLEETDRERLVRAQVGEAYVEALAARRSLDTLGQLSRLNQEYLRVAQARVDQGEAAPVERGLLQVEFSRNETDRLKLESDLNRALVALKNLAGLKLDAEVLLDGELTSQSLTFNITALIDRALAARPDVQAARIDEQVRNAEIREARAEATPNVVGFVRYAFRGSRFDQLGLNASGQTVPLTDHDNVLTGGVSIDLKTRNRNQGEIEAAIAREQAAKYRTTSLAQSVEREVRSAASRYDAARKTVAIFDGSLLSQSQQNLNAIRAAYESGELRVFDLLSEQRRLVEVQRSYLDALKEVYLSRLELERAVGGPLQ